jgi:hypothetical protein
MVIQDTSAMCLSHRWFPTFLRKDEGTGRAKRHFLRTVRYVPVRTDTCRSVPEKRGSPARGNRFAHNTIPDYEVQSVRRLVSDPRTFYVSLQVRLTSQEGTKILKFVRASKARSIQVRLTQISGRDKNIKVRAREQGTKHPQYFGKRTTP